MNKDFAQTQQFTAPPENDPDNYNMNNLVPSLINAIFDPDTGKVMTYRKLIEKDNTKAT